MGETRRTIELLWLAETTRDAETTRGADAETTREAETATAGAKPKSKRGRRPGLTVTRVVEAGITLAGAEGLDAVSMRRVAQELGVVPMTLYTYVPDKGALLDLMLDRLYLAMPRADHPDRPWRERLAAVAEENRRLYGEHPWAASLPASRPPLGPGLMAKYEHELRAFDGCGLDDVTRDSALTFLIGFVQAQARSEAEVRAAATRAGDTDFEWWAERGPIFQVVFEQHRYPTATRVGAAAGAALGAAYDPGHAYTFGLNRVLDGLAALIETGDPRR
ncbi:TetR/AcrR family transcriptional regulator [Actinoplanes derwentensis]|uniref:TetR/AcrR family transcriptional regulator n=1 Tax=Actinoplanes derwentensis TaxID=113562 RepID=UPI001A3A1A8A|nr:TetR/AcrR family transcriptional regulator [Actinoplanes derwentensis]GID83825.1 TetR family transcriptional regulator [Actinoplanes derwentensis]